jgi:hypothetical protein
MTQTHVAKNSSPHELPQVRSVQRDRLVASRLAILPPGTYTDPSQPGLHLRVRANSRGTTRSWLYRLGFRGEESRLLLGHFPQTPLEVARSAVRNYQQEEARQGIDPRRAGARRRQERSGRGRDARTITSVELVEVLDKVVDRGSKGMANRLASALSQLFRWRIHRRIVEDSQFGIGLETSIAIGPT